MKQQDILDKSDFYLHSALNPIHEWDTFKETGDKDDDLEHNTTLHDALNYYMRNVPGAIFEGEHVIVGYEFISIEQPIDQDGKMVNHDYYKDGCDVFFREVGRIKLKIKAKVKHD